MMNKILLIDDDVELTLMLKEYLVAEGFDVTIANDGETGAQYALAGTFDLAVLDVMMPKLSGTETLRLIRKNSHLPVIMLTARGDEAERVIGLELGADDYMTKPFGPRELMARIKAVLRRIVIPDNSPKKISIGNLSINLTNYAAYLSDKKLELTLKEFELLCLLVQNPNQAFSREKLLENIWGYEYYGDIRTVDVTVRRIRERIEKDTSNPKYLITKRGIGYYIPNFEK